MTMGIIWGFCLTWVLVRSIGVEAMASYAFAAALGLYLSASNLGVSNLLYALLRHAFLTLPKGSRLEAREGRILSTTLVLFLLTSLAATALFATFARAGDTHAQSAALSVFFAGVALQLPWTSVKAALEATSRHIFYEGLDAMRRTIHLGSLGAILFGAAPIWVFGLHLLVWALAYALAMAQMQATIKIECWHLSRRGLSELYAVVAPKLRPASLFTITEMLLYNGAYLVIPALYASPATLVVYDLFNKLFRMAINANIVLSTVYMPKLTAAWHGGDTEGFRRGFNRLVWLSLGAMLGFAALLARWGEWILTTLLDNQASLPVTMIAATVLAAFGNALQNSSGSLIIGLGLVREACGLAFGMLSLMTVFTTAVGLMDLGFATWLLGYSLIYLGGSVMWLTTALRLWNKGP